MSLHMRRSPVLVTGATGFIGRRVARRLLAAGRPVLALARGQGGHPAADRVAEAVGVGPEGRLLDVVEGDLAWRGGGLGEAEWRYLRDTVETVIHCAGAPTFFPRDIASFRAAHVDGPLDLLHGLRGGRLRRWAHLSTAYVCGRRSGTVFEHEGDVGQGFHNPYEHVKLESEEALRRAGRRLGIDVRVFRPSIVVGAAPDTAGGNPSNLFFGFIRLLGALSCRANRFRVRLRIPAAPRARFNIVPVEYVAAFVVALAEHPDGTAETFHVVASDPPAQESVLAMIVERLGLRDISLIDPRRQKLRDPSPLERKVARLLSGYREYLEQDVQFDDSNARRLLRRCGLGRSALSREAVHRLIDSALTTPLQIPAPVAALAV